MYKSGKPLLAVLLLAACISAAAQSATVRANLKDGQPAGEAVQIDSTAIQADSPGISSKSACVYVDGIRTDGSAGTPRNAPYNGGYKFPTVASASAYFGRTLVQTVAAQPTKCDTVCPTGQAWTGLACEPLTACTAGIVNSSVLCPGSSPAAYYTQRMETICPSGQVVISSNASAVCPTSSCPPNSAKDRFGGCVCLSGYEANGGSCELTCAAGGTNPKVGTTRVVPIACSSGMDGTAYTTEAVTCTSSTSAAWYDMGLADESLCAAPLSLTWAPTVAKVPLNNSGTKAPDGKMLAAVMVGVNNKGTTNTQVVHFEFPSMPAGAKISSYQPASATISSTIGVRNNGTPFIEFRKIDGSPMILATKTVLFTVWFDNPIGDFRPDNRAYFVPIR